MLSFITFSLCCYAVCFLLADAKIFGCSTAAYLEDPTDTEYIGSAGIWNIRPVLLRTKFFRELFSCYFCMGVWAGPLTHGLLLGYGEMNPDWRYSYFLHDGLGTVGGLLISFAVVSLLGATTSYVLDLIVSKLESSGKDGHPKYH